MSETDPRTDVYTLAAFLSELDRVLHPLLRGSRGRVRLGPMFPPPLPSFEEGTPPPGFGRLDTPGPRSRHGAPRTAASARPHEPSTQSLTAAVPPPPLRAEATMMIADSVVDTRSPARPLVTASDESPSPHVPLPAASREGRSNARASPTPPRLATPEARSNTGNDSPRPVDRAAAMRERARTPPPASAPALPAAVEPPYAAAVHPRLRAPLSMPQPDRTRLPVLPTRAEQPRTDEASDSSPVSELLQAAYPAPGALPLLPLDTMPLEVESEITPAARLLPHAQKTRAPDPSPPPGRIPGLVSGGEDLPEASIELLPLDTDCAAFAPAASSAHVPSLPLAQLGLRRGGRLTLSPIERQRVTHKLSSAFLDRALMRHR